MRIDTSSLGDEKQERFEPLRDRIRGFSNCRNIGDLERGWDAVVDCIVSGGLSPEKDFGLTDGYRIELRIKAHRNQCEDFVQTAAHGLRQLFLANADAIAADMNPLDVGSDPFLQELLEVWKRYQSEE